MEKSLLIKEIYTSDFSLRWKKFSKQLFEFLWHIFDAQ